MRRNHGARWSPAGTGRATPLGTALPVSPTDVRKPDSSRSMKPEFHPPGVCRSTGVRALHSSAWMDLHSYLSTVEPPEELARLRGVGAMRYVR
jgi:hypothetical protein